METGSFLTNVPGCAGGKETGIKAKECGKLKVYCSIIRRGQGCILAHANLNFNLNIKKVTDAQHGC